MPTLPTLVTGQKTVTTPGTPEQVSSDGPCKVAFIKALAGNSGTVYVAAASSPAPSANGMELAAKESITIEVDALSKIWLDVSSGGEGVCWAILR